MAQPLLPSSRFCTKIRLLPCGRLTALGGPINALPCSIALRCVKADERASLVLFNGLADTAVWSVVRQVKTEAPLKAKTGRQLIAWILVLGIAIGANPLVAQETIVAIRHAEKPAGGMGQITCRGLNRAMALPNVLIPRFGKPAAIYAPDPAIQVHDGGSPNGYSYVRPLITIEPTAIALGMPVNAQIGYADIEKLQAELTAPAYQNALIFVAWGHEWLNRFAQRMLKSYGKDPSAVPDWPNNDYDRIYIFRITQAQGNARLTFTVAHQDLDNSLSDACPVPAR